MGESIRCEYYLPLNLVIDILSLRIALEFVRKFQLSPLYLAEDLPRDVEYHYLLLLGAFIIETATDEYDILIILYGD